MLFICAALLLFFAGMHDQLDIPTERQATLILMQVLVGVGAVGIVFGLVYQARLIKRASFAPSLFGGFFVSLLSGILLVSAALMWYNHLLGMRVLYIFLPACAILYFIYAVYERPFFMLCLTHSACAAVLFLLFRLSARQAPTLRLALLIFGLAVCVIAALLLVLTRKQAGYVRLFGVNYCLFGRTRVPALLAVYVATAALLLAAYLISTQVALFAMVALLLFLLGLFVYHTVRLIL